MEKFAGYGFNKSHSAAYALLAYQTAWLKAHYPAAFMAAVISSDMDNTDKVMGFYRETKKMQLTIHSPNVNRGIYAFTANVNHELEYGLGAIKGVGQALVENIVAEREQNGLFKDLFDFTQRLAGAKLNRRACEAFVAAGACDCFNQSRATLNASIDIALKQSAQYAANKKQGQIDLFEHFSADLKQDNDRTNYIDAGMWNFQAQLEAEKLALGYYFSGHPIEQWQQELLNFTSGEIASLEPKAGVNKIIAGYVAQCRHIQTKSGRRMAVLNLEDTSGSIDVTIFSKMYEQHSLLLQKDQILIVKGEVTPDTFSGGNKIVANDIATIEQARCQLARQLIIHFNATKGVPERISKIHQLLSNHQQGQCRIQILYQTDYAQLELQLPEIWRIEPTMALVEQLNEVIDADVRFLYKQATTATIELDCVS